MIRRALPLLALVALAPLLLGAAGDTVRVTPLARDGQVYVSFSLDGGLTPDMRETIRSGLQTTYAYDIELRRGVSIWPLYGESRFSVAGFVSLTFAKVSL